LTFDFPLAELELRVASSAAFLNKTTKNVGGGVVNYINIRCTMLAVMFSL
jgi:hypothetical protein